MLIRTLAHVNVVLFAIGMVLNALLVIFVCKNHGVVSDKSYKPIILQICIMDMLTLVIFIFYMPAFVAIKNNGIFYTLGFFNDVFENAPLFTQIIFITWSCSTLLFVFSPAVQFLYRYLILCRGWKPSYRLYTGFYSSTVFLLLFYTILTNRTVTYVSRTSNALYRDYILTDNPTNANLLVTTIDPSSPWPMIQLGITEVIPISILFVCGIRIWLHFRRHFKSVSITNKSSQRRSRQVNYVLFIQGGMPVIGNLVAFFLGTFVSMKAEYMSFLPNFLGVIIMILNPLLTILLVDSYRQAVLNLFLCRSAKVNYSITAVQTVTTSRL